jgi:hypothetical protein
MFKDHSQHRVFVDDTSNDLSACNGHLEGATGRESGPRRLEIPATAEHSGPITQCPVKASQAI